MIQTYKTKKPFRFESDEIINELTIAYHTFGERNEKDDNIIWVFHALTGNSDVSDWWSNLFGKGKILDPKRYFIICVNTIGSPYGSSCPENLQFPKFTVRDIVRSQILLANQLGINHIYLCIGGSFGGDQALEFAYSFSGKIENLVLIASCAKESAWAIAVHETQRLALASDPTFGKLNGGQEGIKAARAIGMLTYRTSKLFIDKQTDEDEKVDNFSASSYMKYQGDKFAERFTALSYYYLTKCLDSHDLGRQRGGVNAALSRVHIRTLVIGIDSDMLIPSALQEEIYNGLPLATFNQISSPAGHDGFLIEGDKITSCITKFLQEDEGNFLVHKFGGKSLANGESVSEVLNIIEDAISQLQPVVVVSARGNTTDDLLHVYKLAASGGDFVNELNKLIHYQKNETDCDFHNLDNELKQLLQAVSIIGIDHELIKDKVVAYGELFSAYFIVHELNKRNIDATFVDARKLLVTKNADGEYEVDQKISRDKVSKALSNIPVGTIPVITGFISSDAKGNTTNLGRNGSNYSASLIACFIRAKGLFNWTDVEGVFSANPKHVPSAKLIQHLSFREANELANFGTTILHAKTILPLIEHQIPLYIKNSHNPQAAGTRIDFEGSTKSIKAVSAMEDVCLIAIEGSGLMGKVGIDSRIFSCLSVNFISVRLISQASTERGIGFVIDRSQADLAIKTLHAEFEEELTSNAISSIRANNQVAIIAITGRHNYALEKAIQGLRKNKIWIHLFSNSISGENISMVIDKHKMVNALNIVHDYVAE